MPHSPPLERASPNVRKNPFNLQNNRQPLDGGLIRIFHQQDLIAEHALARGKGGMIVEPSHYGNLPRRSRVPASPTAPVCAEQIPGPGVGLHYTIPEVELRPLSIYNSFCEEAAHVAAV